MRRKPERRRAKDFCETVRSLALALPGAEEGPCYGTPGFRVRKKLFARLHPDGESLVLKVDAADRDILIQEDPEIFFITDHYTNHAWVLVRLAKIEPDELKELLEEAWRLAAPARLLTAFDAQA